MFCTKCGSTFQGDEKFCTKCGAPRPAGHVPPAAPAPQPTPQPAPQPTPQPAPQPTPQPAPQPTPQPTPQPAPQPAPAPVAPPPVPKKKRTGLIVAIVALLLVLALALAVVIRVVIPWLGNIGSGGSVSDSGDPTAVTDDARRSRKDKDEDDEDGRDTVETPADAEDAEDAADEEEVVEDDLDFYLPAPDLFTDPDAYILPTDTRYLTEADLLPYDAEELKYIRNEIYARHGYTFTMDKFRDYFLTKSWYVEDPSVNANTFGTAQMNEYEVANLDLIKAREAELGG